MTEALADLRRFSLNKVARSAALYRLVLKQLRVQPQASLVYLTLSPRGFSFLRDLGLIAAFRSFRIPHVYHMHGRGIEERAVRSAIWRSICKFAFSKAYVIVLSEHLYADVARFVPRERAYVVPNGIPDFPSNEEVSELITCRSAGSVPRLLFLSNMLRAKGPLVLLDALNILVRRGLRFKAVFAGPWRGSITREQFADDVMRLGLRDYVHHIGPVYDLEKQRLFRQADIFVLPTNYENEAFPLVVLEAYAYGLPVVTSNIAGLPDMVVENETGFTLPPEDPEKLADKLQELISNPMRRIHLAQGARRRFESLYTSEAFDRNLSDALLRIRDQACLATRSGVLPHLDRTDPP
jgi:glycosyltransferase involved in cell wall biosynthesis